MARGKRKTLENKIEEKTNLIESLQTRIKSEQKELEELCNEKRVKELEILDEIVKTSGLDEYEIRDALESYINLKQKSAS